MPPSLQQSVIKFFQRKNVQETLSFLSKFRKFCLGSILICVGYCDPGNYSTNISAGSTNRFSLLFIVLLSNLIAIFLQALCIKLGSVTGLDLPNACRVHLNKYVNWSLYVFSEIAIIATDLAEVIGTAIALNILLKIPLPAGVVLTIVDVFIVLLAYRPGGSVKLIRYIEICVAVFVLAVVVCFIILLKMIPASTSVKAVFRGFAPSSQMFEHNGMYTATSILGATVMPHSLILGSSLVKPRLREYDERHNHISAKWFGTTEEAEEFFYFNYKPTLRAINYSLKVSIVELTVTLFTVALFVNCAILIVSGASLYGTPEAKDADLYTIHSLLSKVLSPAAGTIFMVALLLSGLMAGVVCTMSGQIVSEGHLNWTIKPWKRRMITRSIAIIPTLIVSVTVGKNGLSQALNASQVCLSILLPFITAPLIFFTCRKSVMKVEIKNDYKIDIKEKDYSETESNAAGDSSSDNDCVTRSDTHRPHNVQSHDNVPSSTNVNNADNGETKTMSKAQFNSSTIEMVNFSSRNATNSSGNISFVSSASSDNRGGSRAQNANTATASTENINERVLAKKKKSIIVDDNNNKKYLDMSNDWVTAVLATVVWVFVCVLNIYTIVQLGITGGETG